LLRFEKKVKQNINSPGETQTSSVINILYDRITAFFDYFNAAYWLKLRRIAETELFQMTLNILLGEIQAKGKTVKREENNIETGFRGINETSKNVGNFIARLRTVLHCAVG